MSIVNRLLVREWLPGSSQAFIEVRQKTAHVNYLMKAAQSTSRPGWQTFEWPTTEVISKNRIRPNSLGVVVHMGEDNEYAENIEPAILTSATSPAKEVTDPGPIHYYDLTLRIQLHSLDKLLYTFQSKGGVAKTCYYVNDSHPCEMKEPDDQASIESGSLVTLKLDMSANEPDGDASVHIEGSYKDSDGKLIANFRFPHESRCR